MALTEHDLAMIVPTRGRPQNAVDLWTCWRTVTSPRSAIFFVVDDNDEHRNLYASAISSMSGAFMIEVLNATGDGMVGALNAAARRLWSEYRYLGFMGDDHRPRTHDWDERLIEAFLKQETGVVYGNDLLQREAMPTAVVMTSDIPRALGYMAPPQFRHLCVDLVWKDWGERIDRLTYLDDVIIEHVHPAAAKAPTDARYEAVNAPEVMAHDGAAYYNYRDNGGLAADVEKLKALLA